MSQTSNYLVNAAIRHQVYLERLKAGQVRNVHKSIQTAEDELVKRLYEAEVASLDKLKIRELRKMLEDLRAIEYEVMTNAQDELKSGFPDLIAIEEDFEARSIGRVLDHELTLPDAQAIYKKTLKTPISATGELLEGFVDNMSAAALKKTNGLINRAYNEGWTVQQAVQGLRGTKANGYRDGITAIKRRQAEAVVRTSLQQVSSDARFQTWAANSDIIDGYEWVATLDASTTAQCRSLDGQKFKLGKGPKPPIHVNCRSTTAPTFDDGLDFLDTDATRSAMNGPVSADMSYYDWLKTQSRSFVKEVLGAERAKLFLDSGISAKEFGERQLNKVFEPLTLEELRKAYPKMFEDAGL